jgi:hypothetical protein
VSEYGLDNRVIGVRSSAGAKYFPSSLSVQTGSGAHPAPCTMGTGGHFPWAKRGRGVTLTTHPHLMPRSRMSRSYISSPPSATIACSGTALLCILLITKIFKVFKYTFYNQSCMLYHLFILTVVEIIDTFYLRLLRTRNYVRTKAD